MWGNDGVLKFQLTRLSIDLTDEFAVLAKKMYLTVPGRDLYSFDLFAA